MIKFLLFCLLFSFGQAIIQVPFKGEGIGVEVQLKFNLSIGTPGLFLLSL